MSLDLRAGLLAFLAVALWRFMRRRTPHEGGPLPDVPDAGPTAVSIGAPPGLTLPYSSLDPTAPPKRHPDGTRVDGVPDS